MNGAMPTPYDIVNPSEPAFSVPQAAWWLLAVITLLAWGAIWFSLKRRKRGKGNYSLPPIVKELSEVLDHFQKTEDRRSLHLFVKITKRHLEHSATALTNSVTPFLEALERDRFAPSPSKEVTSHMREIISICSQRAPSETPSLQLNGAQHV